MLVVGATGGVGQLVCAKLVDRGFYVRALTRDAAVSGRGAMACIAKRRLDRLHEQLVRHRPCSHTRPAEGAGAAGWRRRALGGGSR